jgi:hypothetical protein
MADQGDFGRFSLSDTNCRIPPLKVRLCAPEAPEHDNADGMPWQPAEAGGVSAKKTPSAGCQRQANAATMKKVRPQNGAILRGEVDIFIQQEIGRRAGSSPGRARHKDPPARALKPKRRYPPSGNAGDRT